MFSFWLEYSCPLLKSKEIREVEAEVELWKRDVAVLGRAGQGCSGWQRPLWTQLWSPRLAPAWCHAMAARAEGDSGLTLENVALEALEDLGLWFMQAWGSVGCEPV